MVDTEVVVVEERDLEMEIHQGMVEGVVLDMDLVMQKAVALKVVVEEAVKDVMVVLVLGLVLDTATMDAHENDRFHNN